MVIEAILLAAAMASPAPMITPLPTPSPAPLPVPSAAPGIPPSITLQQAIDIAAAKSPVLAAARANYQLTQIPVQLAKTAIFPFVSATGTSTHSNAGTVAGRNTGSFTSNNLTASLRQLIYDGGRVIAQIHQARASAVAGAGTYERALETLSFNVAQAYYFYLQAQATVQVDKQLVRLNQANEALVGAQVQTGVAPRIDLVTVHVPTVQAEVVLIQAQGSQASALGAFANQLGLDANTLVQPVNNNPSNPAQTLVKVLPYDQAVMRALALRPDYLAAQFTVLAQKYNVQVQRSALLPSLTGTAAYGTSSTTVTGSNFMPNSSVGLSLSIPIYDQGVARAQTEIAQADLDLANAQLAQTKLLVQLNVQQAVVSLISDQAAVTQAEAALAAAQISLRAAQAQYKAGVINLYSLLQAQTNLTSAETAETNAVFTLRQAEQNYIYALGESSLNPTSL